MHTEYGDVDVLAYFEGAMLNNAGVTSISLALQIGIRGTQRDLVLKDTDTSVISFSRKRRLTYLGDVDIGIRII